MKKLLLIAALLLPSFSYSAVEINTNGLNDAEKAQLVTMAEQLKSQKKSAEPITVEPVEPSTVEKWTNFAQVFGKTLSTTAKEIGIQVNEFVQTPVGKLTAFIIVYKYVGHDVISLILHVVGAFSVLIIGTCVMRRLYKGFVVPKIKYNTEVKNIFGNHPKMSEELELLKDSESWAFSLVMRWSCWPSF